ncbi:ABC transporter ATP-binding protein [Poseidonibacter lekithochrous]|uniref:ABC transporter ATP-binding protein n=1 Tax=Poseidonibacter lekithochrous TaxID=1904463 RepID=UPI000D362933|nr:ABC transporter ATP-binding protein [Poseidonibacter lekithochrous]
MAKITLSNLAHSYMQDPKTKEDYVLQPLNHEWDDGAAYALLGPSGCGKSTLLNIISGILTPSEGSILFDGTDVTFADTTNRNIAQVFQFPVVYDTMTVRQNLEFPLRNRGADEQYIQQRVGSIARAIQVEDILDKKARGLTADAKQKISLGRGMVREDVNAILFDEPLTVIDPHMKWELRTQLKALHKELKHTMIFVTHDQTEALTFADKVVVMNQGHVLQIGTPEELFSKPAHTFVGYFIGSPGMNVFESEIDGNIANLQGYEIKLNSTYKKLSGKIELGIRPEFIELCEDGEGIKIEITRVEDIAHHKIVRAKYNDRKVNIIVPEDVKITPTMSSMKFKLEGVNVYVDDWLVEGELS